MDVRLSDEQELLRESAREFLERECPMGLVREAMDDAVAAVEPLWKGMSELGWTGLIVPEEHGGAGLGWIDVAVLMEEMGRVLLPAPYFSSAVLCAALVERLGDVEQRARILPRVADGRLRLALALLEENASWDLDAPRLSARAEGSAWRLEGVKHFVADTAFADALLVVARTDDGLGLFEVPSAADGVEIATHRYTDETRKMARVSFHDVRLAREALFGEPGEPAVDALRAVLDRGRAVLAAEMVGAAERVLALSVDYARAREQFGRPIGAFQAIQHKCADMLVKVETARSAAYYAAWAVDEAEPDAADAACLAKAYCSEAFAAVAGEGIQIHGGLGFTWEQDLHLYYKRALADELALGSPTWCREQVAARIID